MNRVRQAVILAAGVGSRLRGIHDGKPKGFIRLGDKPIIEESIARLVRAGMHTIIIVTGYENRFFDELRIRYPFVRTVRNDSFATTGSMYSLWTARNLIDQDFLLLESDLLYEFNALQTLLNTPESDVILLSGETGAGDEVYVGVNGSRIVNMSKNISDISHVGGELVGISRISLELYRTMVTHAETQFAARDNYHYEDCLTDLAAEREINHILVDDLAWIEIDDESHYRRAVEVIYPRIRERDRNTPPTRIPGRNILLNPGPATTTDTVKFALVVEDICPREKPFGELVESIRRDLVTVVHGEETHEAVLFAGSGTGAVEACLTSVVPDEKAVLIINNGAYGRRMQQICDGFGIRHIDHDIPYGDPVNLVVVRDLVQTHGAQLSHIAVVHHETTVGILNPVDDISRIAQEHGLEIIVDAMSSFAGIPIDVGRVKIHYLTSSANKCIQGMAGVSFVICDRTSLEKTAGYRRRNFYFNLFDNYTFFTRHRQMQFTPPVQILYALRQAINEYFIETEGGRAQRYKQLYTVLKSGLRELGFKFLVDEQHHAKILTAIIEPDDPRYNFDQMHDYLYERGFTIYPGKGAKINTFRLSNMGELYVEDIRKFLVVLKEYMEHHGITMAQTSAMR